MTTTKTRKINERFYDVYSDFDEHLCQLLDVDDDGVQAYRMRMKEAWYEAKEAIPEWETIDKRLENIRERYLILKKGGSRFDDFHGKDEDVVWMKIFKERLDAKADPLSKYSRLNFGNKKRNKSFFQRLVDLLK